MPLEEAQGVLQEYSWGPPMAPVAPSYAQQSFSAMDGLAAAAASGRMVARTASVPVSAYAARGVQSLLGNALALSSNFMARAGTNLVSSMLGGPYSKEWTGKGSQGQIKVTMNAPGNTRMRQTIGGAKKGTEQGLGGGVSSMEISKPTTPNVNVSNIFYRETPEGGAEIELYRSDPLTGESRGAPVKNFTIRLQGSNPTKVRDIENNIAASITSIAQKLIGGKPLKLPRPTPVRRGYRL